MTNASESNESVSATTSSRSPELPEDQLLRQEAAEAQAALQQAALQLGMVLRDATDMRRWIRRYPWPSVVAAVALGAVAVPAAIAGGEKVAERWQDREHRKHRARSRGGRNNGNGRHNGRHSAAERSLRLAGLLLRQSRKLGMLLGGTAAAGAGAGLGDLLKALRAGMQSYAARETERVPDEAGI